MEIAYGCTSMSIEGFYRSQNLYRVLKRGLNAESLPVVSLGKGKGKDKVHPRIGHEGQRGRICIPYSSFTLGARWGGWSTPRTGRFTSGKDPVPIILEAGWASGTFWTDAKKLAPTGIRFPDRPTRIESLY